MRQSLGLPASFILIAPPKFMRSTDSLSVDRVIQFMVSLEAEYFRVEGDYMVFIQTHLMPSLTGVRRGEGVRALAARAGPRVTRAARARGRGASQARQRTGWPKLPTALTCWRYIREAYQIPIEPTAAGHRYVRGHDAPPAPPRYTEDLLELLASFDGMILRREALLGFHGIQHIVQL
ncbi:hypothetical protein CsSME_00041583 [Camellia sinensis var. sinensis]